MAPNVNVFLFCCCELVNAFTADDVHKNSFEIRNEMEKCSW